MTDNAAGPTTDYADENTDQKEASSLPSFFLIRDHPRKSAVDVSRFLFPMISHHRLVQLMSYISAVLALIERGWRARQDSNLRPSA